MASWIAARLSPRDTAPTVVGGDPTVTDRDGTMAQRVEAAANEPKAPEPGLKALGRAALEHDAAPAMPGSQAGNPAADPPDAAGTVRADDDAPAFDLARVAWLVTVLACLLAVTILVLNGYIGYAGVTLAVALAAAINLL
jgi:hypothetical protein